MLTRQVFVWINIHYAGIRVKYSIVFIYMHAAQDNLN